MSERGYFNSIDDILLYNWRKCVAGELKYVRTALNAGNEKKDAEAWEKVYDSYLAEFGLGKEYEQYLTLKKELILKNCEFAISGDRFVLNRIEILEHEIDLLMQKKGETDLDTAIIYVSKWFGSMINDKEITAKMFFKMSHEYEKYYEAKLAESKSAQ